MIVKEAINGTILVDGAIVAIRLGDLDSEGLVYVAYALITQGPEHQILPSVLLDDWGNEVGKLELYRWIKENGLHFPRAEVFGQTPSGVQVQYFLRDLELFAKYPVYAYSEKDGPDNSGLLVQAILVPDTSAKSPQSTKPPEGVSEFLSQAQVTWWRVDPTHDDLGFIK